jgi:hypothetical protein
VGEAELGEHRARGDQAEVLDQVLAQQPHRHRVEEKRTLPGELDYPPLQGRAAAALLDRGLLRAWGRPTPSF